MKLEADEIIAIVWNDIESNAGWSTKEELDKSKSAECKTVGFFHHIKDSDLVVKHSIAYNGDSDFTTIPVGCIQRIRLLKLNDEYNAEIKKIKGKYNIYIRKNG